MAKTLELYNALKDKLGERGTKILISAIDEAAEKGHSELATKEDLAKLEVKIENKIDRLDAKIDKVELSLRAEIEKSKTDVLRWLFIFWAGQIGATFALFKFFLK
ncbi:MAG: CCDC90 family protein [Candidatus Magnetoovum sp. WYHC-5]|nr:CCDC90 family protein [Candidatus Magnetoovum sp. WYHC-5]